MVFLKKIILFFFLCSFFSASAQKLENHQPAEINKIQVSCNQESPKCNKIKKKIEQIKTPTTKENFENYLFRILDQPFIQNLEINYHDTECKLSFNERPVIEKVSFKINEKKIWDDEFSYIKELQGIYFEEVALQSVLSQINQDLIKKGYRRVKTSYDFSKNHLKIFAEIEDLVVIKRVHVKSNEPEVEAYISLFKQLQGHYYDREEISKKIEEVRKVLLREGYKKNEIIFQEGSKKRIQFKLYLGQRYIVHFRGNKYFNQKYLRNLLDKYLQQEGSDYNGFITYLQKEYREKSYIQTKIETESYLLNKALVVIFEINEGERKKITLNFEGNKVFTTKELIGLYKKEGSTLAKNYYHDDKYSEGFIDVLKEFYARHGFLQTKVSKEINGFAHLYTIKERSRTYIQEILFETNNEEVEKSLFFKMPFFEGDYFDPYAFEAWLKKVSQEYVETYGVNLNFNQDIVTYRNNYESVVIKLKVWAGKESKIGKIYYWGNWITRDKVIEKILASHYGKTLNKKNLDYLKHELSELNIFSDIRFVVPEEKDTLYIHFTERKYGKVRLSPGYRSDLGLKLALGLSYNNVARSAKKISLEAQVNQRFDYSVFDNRRQEEKDRVMEYKFDLYFQNPLWRKRKIKSESHLMTMRRRYFSFDADIHKIVQKFSKDIGPKFSFSFGGQYEYIHQTDATDREKDQGNLYITSLLSSFYYQSLNSKIFPKKGYSLALHSEYPLTFLSENKNNLDVDYLTWLARTRFYVPAGKKWVFALGLSFAQQYNFNKNLIYRAGGVVRDSDGQIKTQGNIPSIKVLRLTGLDTVRGYSEQEINKRDDGRDVIDGFIQDKVSLFTLKFEPRYLINDKFSIAPFYDTGRSFAGQIRFRELRHSAGLSLKYITPVGVLEFSYGHKLHRKRYHDGSRDDAGRFHVSLGLF